MYKTRCDAYTKKQVMQKKNRLVITKSRYKNFFVSV